MTQTLGEEIIDWIETLRVPEGALVGQPLVLVDWQKRAILRIYDNPARTRRAIISVGRKSGKSALCACLMLAHLAGPVAVPNSQLFSTAQSRDQAALLYALAAKIVRMSRRLSNTVVCKDATKQLVSPTLGTAYRALSAEASSYCLDFLCENAAESTIARRNCSQIEAGEVVCGLLKHGLEQRSEAFLVR
jgi:phage terminase large subunit-like protein